MALFVNQENTRTKLQERIAADLTEKAKKKAGPSNKTVDGVDDSVYLEQTKGTTTLAWAWILIVVAAVALIVWIAAKSLL